MELIILPPPDLMTIRPPVLVHRLICCEMQRLSADGFLEYWHHDDSAAEWRACVH